MVDRGKFSDVRQLCLRLRPILGARMDQIYAAYLAEDVDGRIRLSTTLNYWLQKHIPHSLGQDEQS